jgi:PAS domain S-box-containing protein
MKSLHRILLSVLIAPVILNAQRPHAMFERLSVEQGLSQSQVMSLCQDSQGFMWIGTRNGLNRYDGYEFVQYTKIKDDSTSVSDNLINALFEDRDGNLWIGSGNGLNRFDPSTRSFVRYFHSPSDANTLSNNHIQVIAQDKEGNLWIGTSWGLNRYDSETRTFSRRYFGISGPDSADHNRIWDVIAIPDGRLVIATDAGLRFFNPKSGEFSLLQHHPGSASSISSNQVRRLLYDEPGLIWIGTLGGLCMLDLKSGIISKIAHDPDNPNTISRDGVTALLKDRFGDLWVGTEWGLNRYDSKTGQWNRYFYEPDDPYSLSNNHVSVIYESQSGILWFGTYNWGLNKYVPAKQVFQYYPAFSIHDATGYIDHNVISLFQSPNEIFWIGTYGGLFQWDRRQNRIRHYYSETRSNRAPIGAFIQTIQEDQDGFVWIGSSKSDRSGLSRYNPRNETFLHYQHDPENRFSISSNDVNVVLVDRTGTLWIGTDGGGLNRYDPSSNRFIHYTTDYNDTSRIAGNWINTLLEDHAGMLWIGTDQGISRLNKEKQVFRNYRYHPDDPAALVGQRITALFEDSRNRFWIATENGLNLMDRESGLFTTYNALEIASSAIIYSILEDRSGLLWLGTSSGLLSFDPDSKSFHEYDESDGLHVVDFNAGSALRSPDGELFFGGKSGLIGFYPEQIQSGDYVPPVVITDVRVSNQLLPAHFLQKGSDPIRLGHRDRSLSFEFVTLDYTCPLKNQYLYMLEGFDSEWIRAGERRFANYTNLNPGKYTFRVKGSSVYDVWNEKGAQVTFVIVSPFWQTVWFRFLVILFVCAMIYSGYRYRMRRHERREKELTEEVDHRTRELAQSRGEYQRLYDDAPVGYHELDLEGRILHVNRTEADLLGYSPGEMVGRLVFDFIAPDERNAAKDNFRNNVAVNQETEHFERKYLRKNGEEIYFSLLTKKVTDTERHQPVIHTALIDVTRVKKLEEQLLQSQKMEAIGRLAGGIAHDFNNLLTVLRGRAALVLGAIPKDHLLRDEIELIDKAGERAEQLTRQLLAFSRKQQLRPEIINLNDLILNLKKMLDPLIGEDVALVTQLDPGLGLIQVDPGQIEQVIINLAVNARDAMPNGGTLRLETRNVILDEKYLNAPLESLPGPYILMIVNDTGIGMQNETREHIFEPFFTTKEETRGTGLGLSMVYGIVKQSLGQIQVDSEPDVGTTFKIYFPQVKGNSIPPITRKDPVLDRKGEEIVLVLEDDDHVRQFVSRALKQLGYQVLEAADYNSAMSVCKNHSGPIHLVLSDVIMPNMNGPEIVKQIKESHPGIKVLFMSGYNDDIISHEGVLEDGINFIQKPFSLNDLARQVKEVIEGV